MGKNFIRFAPPIAIIFSFFSVFYQTYKERSQISSVIKPIIQNHIGSGDTSGIFISLQNIKATNPELSNILIYDTQLNKKIIGDPLLLEKINSSRVPFLTDLHVRYDLTFLKQIIYDNQNLGIIISFDDGDFILWLLLLTTCIYALLYLAVSMYHNFKERQEKIYQEANIEFANWVVHEVCEGICRGDPEIRIRNIKGLFLLLNHKIDMKNILLTELIVGLSKEFCPDQTFTTFFNHHESMFVSDQPLGIIFTNLITNCVKNNEFGLPVLRTWIENNSFHFSARNNVSKKCSDNKIARFYGNNERTGLSLVRRSLNTIGCDNGSLEADFSDNYTEISLNIPLRLIEIKGKTSKINVNSIAIIDDQKMYRNRLFDRLEALSYKCQKFSHIDYFYDEIETGVSFDVVIVDRFGDNFEDPKMDKWDAIKDRFSDCVRKLGYKGKIVLYSNAAIDAEGFDAILSKTDTHDWDVIIKGLFA